MLSINQGACRCHGCRITHLRALIHDQTPPGYRDSCKVNQDDRNDLASGSSNVTDVVAQPGTKNMWLFRQPQSFFWVVVKSGPSSENQQRRLRLRGSQRFDEVSTCQLPLPNFLCENNQVEVTHVLDSTEAIGKVNSLRKDRSARGMGTRQCHQCIHAREKFRNPHGEV